MLVVTGPTGNVGADLTRLLVDGGHDLPYRLAAHDPAKLAAEYGATHGDGLPVVRLDYDDRSTWPAALAGIRTLFLLYPLPHPRTVNTRMIPFVDAAIATGCEHVIYVATPGSDTIKFNPHYKVERHVEASGVGWTFLHPSYFAQNLVRRISTHGYEIALRDEIFIPAGNGHTTFVDSRDVAAVAFKVARDPAAYRGRTLTLTGPERLDFHQVAGILTDVLGRPIRYTPSSFPRFWFRALCRGARLDVLAFMTLVYSLTRSGRNEPTTDELERELGRPGLTVRRFAEDYRWRWERMAWT